MSSASVSSSKHERAGSELPMELEAARSLNTYLRTYLSNIQITKKSIMLVNSKLIEMHKVNKQWVDVGKVRMK